MKGIKKHRYVGLGLCKQFYGKQLSLCDIAKKNKIVICIVCSSCKFNNNKNDTQRPCVRINLASV